MTGEQFTIVVRAALDHLSSMSNRELAEIEPWLTRKAVRHVRDHVTVLTPRDVEQREKIWDLLRVHGREP